MSLTALRGALVGLGLLAASTPARADSRQFLNLGVIGSVADGARSSGSLGGELSLTNYADDDPFDGTGIGGFVDVEVAGKLPDGGADQRRYAAGLQIVHGWYGVDGGALYRTAPGLVGTGGVQLGAFVTIGYVSLELRASLSSTGTIDKPQYGSDIGLVMTAKLPLQVGGTAIEIKDISLVPCILWCKRH